MISDVFTAADLALEQAYAWYAVVMSAQLLNLYKIRSI